MTLTIWFDGRCAVCAYEMAQLALRDHAGRLQLIDYQAPDFDTASFETTYPGKSRADLHRVLHAWCSEGDGSGYWLTGVDALAATFEAVGRGALWRITRWPVLRAVFDWLYMRFANNRSWLTRPLAGFLNPKTARARLVHEEMRRCKAGLCDLEKAP